MVEGITLCIWFTFAAFNLLVTTCSVAQLDALNRRFRFLLLVLDSSNGFLGSKSLSGLSSQEISLPRKRPVANLLLLLQSKDHSHSVWCSMPLVPVCHTVRSIRSPRLLFRSFSSLLATHDQILISETSQS